MTTGSTIWNFSISNHSVVVGTRETGFDGGVPLWSAFRWTAADGVQDLGPADPTHVSTIGSDINDAGVAVGRSTPGVAQSAAVVWSADGSPQNIGTLDGGVSAAFGINGLGQVVGEAKLVSGAWDAFIWTPEDGMQGLGIHGFGDARALDINHHAEVVGLLFGANRRAFYWNADDGFVDLHALAGFEEPESFGTRINDSGVVTITTLSGTVFRAYVWSREHGTRALPALGPGSTTVRGVNNAGVLVGSSGNSAVIWTPLTVGGLIDYLDELVAGLAAPGLNGVHAKLQAIQAHIANGRITAASNQLAALMNQIEGMVADGSLTPEEGELLLELAQALLDSL